MLNAKDFEKWYNENQSDGLQFDRYTNPIVAATLCYQVGVLDGLFDTTDKKEIKKKYCIMNEIVGALRTFESEELEAIFKYCHNYHSAFQRSAGQNHIITEITVEPVDD